MISMHYMLSGIIQLASNKKPVIMLFVCVFPLQETFAMFTVSIIHDKYKVFTVQPSNVTKSAALQLVVRENYTNFLDYEVPEYRQQNITVRGSH